jgi:5'-methylthioadenosine phosphorylase
MTERIGIIGGSGLGNALLAAGVGSERTNEETPFGRTSAPVMLGEWEGTPIAFLARHGEGHTIPPSAVPYQANIWALKATGCRWVIASGAVGSLREEISPRDLVVCDQAIDRTTGRAGSFFNEAGGGAVHVEFADPFCEELRRVLIEKAKSVDLRGSRVHERGTYVCMEGPAFSTRAESRMHRQWGGDVIGMTALPEAKLAREAELSYALVALVTDYDCWKPHDASLGKQELLKEIIGHMSAATDNALALVRAAIPHVWGRRQEIWPAQRALDLAIWTQKDRISAAAKKRLELLWGKYV